MEAELAIKKGVKRKEGENLTDTNIEKVIGLLEADKPITKKEACEILNIAYNTTRLSKIINEYKDKLETDKKRRAANRGKPATEFEVSTVIENYLTGVSLKEIADSLYRPTDFVKRIIEEVGVPTSDSGEDYTTFGPLPEQCVSDTFEVGQFVWSSKYGCVAEVIKDAGASNDGLDVKVYKIYVYERIDWDKVEGRYSYMPVDAKFGGYYATARAYDLGSLEHLKKFIPDLKRIIK